MVATELLKLTVETDEERKARLKKMVATTQFRLTLYYVFENSKNKRNNLARPVLGTIFLVYIDKNVNESTIVSSLRSLRSQLCRLVYGKPIPKYVCQKCMGGITWPKHAHAQCLFGRLKPNLNQTELQKLKNRGKKCCE